MSARLRAPGWYRAALYIVLGIAFSYALSIGARAGLGYDPVVNGEAIIGASHRQRFNDLVSEGKVHGSEAAQLDARSRLSHRLG